MPRVVELSEDSTVDPSNQELAAIFPISHNPAAKGVRPNFTDLTCKTELSEDSFEIDNPLFSAPSEKTILIKEGLAKEEPIPISKRSIDITELSGKEYLDHLLSDEFDSDEKVSFVHVSQKLNEQHRSGNYNYAFGKDYDFGDSVKSPFPEFDYSVIDSQRKLQREKEDRELRLLEEEMIIPAGPKPPQTKSPKAMVKKIESEKVTVSKNVNVEGTVEDEADEFLDAKGEDRRHRFVTFDEYDPKTKEVSALEEMLKNLSASGPEIGKKMDEDLAFMDELPEIEPISMIDDDELSVEEKQQLKKEMAELTRSMMSFDANPEATWIEAQEKKAAEAEKKVAEAEKIALKKKRSAFRNLITLNWFRTNDKKYIAKKHIVEKDEPAFSLPRTVGNRFLREDLLKRGVNFAVEDTDMEEEKPWWEDEGMSEAPDEEEVSSQTEWVPPKSESEKKMRLTKREGNTDLRRFLKEG